MLLRLVVIPLRFNPVRVASMPVRLVLRSVKLVVISLRFNPVRVASMPVRLVVWALTVVAIPDKLDVI